METTMAKLREMVDVNTIVGDPVVITGETMVLPVSKVSLGFVSGGGEYAAGECRDKQNTIKSAGEKLDAAEGKYPFAGAAAAGLTLNPTAFLSVCGKNVRVLPAQYSGSLDRAVEMLPELMRMIENLVRDGEKGAGCECSQKTPAKE